MSLATQRAALQALLGSVPDIGVVHDCERFAPDWKTYLDRFKSATLGRIQGWTITRESTPESWLTNAQTDRQHQWVLRGIRAIQDSARSEPVFQDLVEAVCRVLRNDPTLQGTAEGDSGPPQVRVFEPRLFGDVLCHYVEITFVGKETMEVGA